MPIKYWIEKGRRRVRAVVSGDFTTDEMLQTLKSITEDSNYERGFDILSDHTNIGEPLTTRQTRQMSAHLENFSV